MEASSHLSTPVQLPASLQASCVRCGQQFSGAGELQTHSLLCSYSSSFDISSLRSPGHKPGHLMDDEEEDEMESSNREDTPSPQKIIQMATGSFVIPPMDKNRASYYCEICRKNFTNYGSYRRHLRMHFCDKKYSCHLCGRQFFRRYLWVKHQEKIHGNDPSSCRCPHCGLWSKNADSLKEHLRTKHRRTNGKEPTNAASMPAPTNPFDIATETPNKGRRPRVLPAEIKPVPLPPPTLQECFKCRECEAEFATEAEVEEHCAVEHDADNMGTGTTSRYGRKRKQRVLFNTELRTGRRRKKSSNSSSSATSPTKFSPGNPSTVISRNGIENENMEGSVGSPPPPSLGSPPPPPPMGSPLPPNLTPAEEDEDDKPLSQLEPEKNDNFSDSKPTFTAKLRRQRGQRGSFYCEKCNRMFINRSSYLRHRKMHTGIKPFTCEFCCLSFFRSESLASHKKKHTDPGDIRCYQCGYRAANSAALRTHFYTVCGREKNLTSLAAQMQDDLELENSTSGPPALQNDQHYMKDSTERDIAGFCSVCNRAFFNQKNFEKHMRLHSVGTPSFSCTLCNKMFLEEQQYQEHLQSHTGNKYPSSLELLKSFGAMQERLESEPSSPNRSIQIKEEPIDLTEDSPQPGRSPTAFSKQNNFSKLDRHQDQSVAGFCRYCGKPFPNKKQVNTHERVCYMTCCREDKMYSCFGCSIYFDGTENLVQHVKAAHLDSVNSGLPSLKDLEQELHDDVGSVELDTSAKRKREKNDNDATRQDLMASAIQKLEEKPQNVELQVTIVDASSKQGGRDESNLPIATKIQQRYKCGRCNDTFGDLKTIFSHFHKTHGVAQAKNGLEVEKVAKELNAVASQQNAQEKTEPVPSLEPPNSIMKQLLSAPPAAPQVNKPVLNCGLCFKSFKEKSALDHHEQLSHVMVDWYKCDVCGKSGSHETMKSHMLSHMHKVGSVVTAVGADLPDIDSPDDNNNERDDDDDFGGRDETADEEGSGTHSPGSQSQNPLEVISVLCQLCKKIFSSTSALGKHRHTGYNLSVTHPFICCMPNCGQCFTLREDILAHLKTQHTNSTWNINRIRSGGPSWSDDMSSGPGPFSQSLLQLSLQTIADNEAKRSSSSSSLLDIYESTEGSKPYPSGNSGGGEIEEITVEPLLEGLQEPAASSAAAELHPEEEDVREEDLSPTPPSSPSAQEAPSYLEDRTKVLLKCDDCDSVFTNPCSWKRHRKLHLGIMKHKCPHCSRMFYRKDHCDKHVKTHSRVVRPRPNLEK